MKNKINRKSLVNRHNIRWNQMQGVIAVGNGEFCFGADATGLQTFSGFSMAHWGWHSFPLPEGCSPQDVPPTGTSQKGSNIVPDEFILEDNEELWHWMTDNPHRMKLGRLMLSRPDGSPIETNHISDISREMNIWEGQHQTHFKLDGQPVSVTTVVHPVRDLVSVRIESPLLADNKLQVSLLFEYPTLNDISGKADENGDLDRTPKEVQHHLTQVLNTSSQNIEGIRKVDQEAYNFALTCEGSNRIHHQSEHCFNIQASRHSQLAFSWEISQKSSSQPLPPFEDVRSASSIKWESIWTTGGAIDLSESHDPRWKELERRVVLSQYHMAAQSSGSWPSAEIGLMGLCPWRGQFHMEMLWWHLAHYGLWGRWEMAEKALECYSAFMPVSRQLAEQLGYKGAMWPKSVGPEGRSAPWGGNHGLLWKQPHPIFFAELEYRLRPTRATLEKWGTIVEATAELMADYPVWDESRECYSLIPCVPPSETGKTRDCIFDIVYWRWGLGKAQEWRERLGLDRHPSWDEVSQQLAPLPVENGVYVRTDEPGTRHNSKNHSHPDPVGIYGMLPLTENLDTDIASKTVRTIIETWKWDRCWGWDFPWTAMSAARTGQSKLALDILLKGAGYRNEYDPTGLNQGGPCHYLPGNGGLLYVVAMMAAGWDGCEIRGNAPGFPQDGSWTVKWEGLHPAI